jgi:hypothetical protein
MDHYYEILLAYSRYLLYLFRPPLEWRKSIGFFEGFHPRRPIAKLQLLM